MNYSRFMNADLAVTGKKRAPLCNTFGDGISPPLRSTEKPRGDAALDSRGAVETHSFTSSLFYFWHVCFQSPKYGPCPEMKKAGVGCV